MNKEIIKSLKISEKVWKILKEYCEKENKKMNKEVEILILKYIKENKKC